MYGYIYETINLINNKRYIGQHKSCEFDISYKGSGKLLTEAINKYGKSNFETHIIEECESQEELNDKEIYWINYYQAVENDNFYNLDIGGKGSHEYSTSEETRKKLSDAQKGKRVINKDGKVIYVNSDELETYISNGWSLGYNYSTEQIDNKIKKFKQTHYSKDNTKWKSNISKAISNQLWVTNDKETLKINSTDLSYYLNNGYRQGRTSNTWNKNKICLYTYDGHRKYVHKDEKQKYLNEGYLENNPKV